MSWILLMIVHIIVLPLSTFLCTKLFVSKKKQNSEPAGITSSCNNNDNNDHKSTDLEIGLMASGALTDKMNSKVIVKMDSTCEQETQQLSDRQRKSRKAKKNSKHKAKHPSKTYATPAAALFAAGVTPEKISSVYLSSKKSDTSGEVADGESYHTKKQGQILVRMAQTDRWPSISSGSSELFLVANRNQNVNNNNNYPAVV